MSMNFNDSTALVALYKSMAEQDSVAEQMVGMVSELIAADLPVESKQAILGEAQATLSKVRKDSPALGTAYNYSSRAKAIFGAMVQGFVPVEGRNCAGIYSDAAKYLKSLSVNWKGEAVEPKAQKSAEDEVTAAAVAVDLTDVTAALETVEKHAAHLLATKGPDYVIELIAALTAQIDKPATAAA